MHGGRTIGRLARQKQTTHVPFDVAGAFVQVKIQGKSHSNCTEHSPLHPFLGDLQINRADEGDCDYRGSRTHFREMCFVWWRMVLQNESMTLRVQSNPSVFTPSKPFISPQQYHARAAGPGCHVPLHEGPCSRPNTPEECWSIPGIPGGQVPSLAGDWHHTPAGPGRHVSQGPYPAPTLAPGIPDQAP